MNQAEILDRAKAALGTDSDSALAKKLKVDHTSISKIRMGRNNIGPELALKIAEISGIPAEKIAAAAYAARSKTQDAKRKWERMATLCVVLALGSTFGGNVKAEDLQTKHYARRGRKRRMRRPRRAPIRCNSRKMKMGRANEI
jgi:Bacteriophage CI repressor helix-turn-helix domain.